MNSNMFLYLDNDGKNAAPGEAKQKPDKLEKAIDIISWDWEVEQKVKRGADGSIQNSGRPNVKRVVIKKYIDAATPPLLQLCCRGQMLKEAKILCLRSVTGSQEKGAPAEKVYLTLLMAPVVITSIDIGEAPEDVNEQAAVEGRIIETVTLTFSRVKMIYQAYKDDGSKAAAPDASHDVTTGEEKY